MCYNVNYKSGTAGCKPLGMPLSYPNHFYFYAYKGGRYYGK